MILTPEKMRNALAQNPFEVLIDTRPAKYFSARIPPEGVPVLFEHDGMQFLGWQTRGMLPLLFNCEYQEMAAVSTGSPSRTGSAGEDRFGKYIAYADGTVLDTETRLMWMRCALGQRWDGKTCMGYATMNWENACKQNGDGFAGYYDWRLPTLEELKSLVDNKQIGRDKIHPEAFPNCSGGGYWATPPSGSYTWVIKFYDALSNDLDSSHSHDYCVPRDYDGHVRLVRGGQ